MAFIMSLTFDWLWFVCRKNIASLYCLIQINVIIHQPKLKNQMGLYKIWISHKHQLPGPYRFTIDIWNYQQNLFVFDHNNELWILTLHLHLSYFCLRTLYTKAIAILTKLPIHSFTHNLPAIVNFKALTQTKPQWHKSKFK